MTRLERLQADLPTATYEPADVAWLVDRVDECAAALREADAVLVGSDVAGAERAWPHVIRVKRVIHTALARLEEPDHE